MTSINAPSSAAPAITTQPLLSTTNTEDLNPVSVEPPISLSNVDLAVITTQPLMNPEEEVEKVEKRFNQFNPSVVPPPVQPPPADDSGACCLSCLDLLDCTLECGSCCIDCGECCANCCNDCGNCCTSCCENGDTDVDANTIGDCCECFAACFECCSGD